MTLIGILAAISVLLVWLIVRHPHWFVVAGRALFDAMAVAGRWYSLTEPAIACRALDPTQDIPVDPPFDITRLDEAGLTARLLNGTLRKEDYHRAMAALAEADAARHPVPFPPGADG